MHPMKALDILQQGIIRLDKHIIYFDCGCQMYYNLESGNKVLNIRCLNHQPNPGCISIAVGQIGEDWLTNLS